ncbi:MAG TPA: hypothetical protein VMT08_10865 [Bradyrhizobium sp.]|nr:hypothetical protein [Bradyrhizobium sp.]
MVWAGQITLRNGVINRLATITVLAWSFLALLCVSLVLVSQDVQPSFHIGFDSRNAWQAALSVAAFSSCVPLLTLARSPMGFAASFYLLAITAGYLWLSYFTPLQYDHVAARLSAAASWAAFALPALLITRSPSTRDLLNHKQVNLLAGCLILLSTGIAARGYSLGLFHFVIDHELLRATLNFPTWMRYAIPISATTALPFAYAWFFTQKRYFIAAIALVVSLAYYPITLNKTTMLTPLWLIAMTVLLRFTSWRIAVVLSLMLPTILGLSALALDPNSPELIFRAINFRMLAIPASAIDHYNHFFSTHPLTNFCQISIIGKIFGCSLPEQLGIMMAEEYHTGNYNASLLATEGIAAVGVYFAPIATLLCGLVIALGNMASDRLDPAFVLLSGSILLVAMMNVPLSTVMLTHGGILLFTLWLVTPRKPGTERAKENTATVPNTSGP